MTIGDALRPASDTWRPRSALTLIALLCVAVLAAGSARASTSSLDGTTGPIGVRSARLQVSGVLSASLGARYYESTDLSDTPGCDPGRYASLHLAASYGVSTWLEAGFDLPFRRASWRCDDGGDRSVQAIDNPSVALKVGLPSSTGPFHFAALARFGLPIDEELTVRPGGDADEDIYLTGGPRPDWEVLLLATVDFTESFPLRLHVNAGWAFHREDDRGRRFYPSYYPAVSDGGEPTDNDALILRGAVEFPGRSVDLFTEFGGDMIRDRDLVAPKENALAIAPGVRVRFARGWSATVGLSVGVSGNDRSTAGPGPGTSPWPGIRSAGPVVGSQIKLYTLRQGKILTPINRVGLPAHIELPGIRAGLAATAGFLFPTKSTADFRTGGTDVHVGDAAI